jgi:hypothetical protein
VSPSAVEGWPERTGQEIIFSVGGELAARSFSHMHRPGDFILGSDGQFQTVAGLDFYQGMP